MRSAPVYRYEALVSHIAALVDGGVLVPGARVPSVRELSRQRQVSVSTVLQAYRVLENRGVIEARPQSGFYVARGGSISLATPARSRPPAKAASVSVTDVVFELLERAADTGLVPLGCAIPSAEVLSAGRLDRCLARAARQRGAQYNTYTPPRGEPRLRQEIARRASAWGQVLSPDDIVITSGCTEALSLALRAVTRPGDTVAIESPTYFGLLQVLEAQGLKALELPTDANSGIDLQTLERALQRGGVAACLLSSSYNNPLGCTMSEDGKRKALALVNRHGVALIEDDIYGDIHFGDARPKPFMALNDAPDAARDNDAGNILYCSSFSKTVAPGYRVGWIATQSQMPGTHMPRVLSQKLASTLCGPALPQVAIAEFLASGGFDRHLRRMRRVFEDNVDRTLRAIGRAFPGGTRVSRPAGGFVLWLELPEPFNSRRMFAGALDRGVCFAPGDVFSASGRYANCMRLSCGHHWNERLERGIETLGEMARDQIQKKGRADAPAIRARN